jgi:hypothetical protein
MTSSGLVGVFRSRDGDEVWGRGDRGYLVPLPADERDAWAPDERHRAMAEALDRFGLWDHLSAEQRTRAAADVASGCYPLGSDLLYEHNKFHADGESLAEFGVERFLQGLAPAVKRHGVSLDVETERVPTGAVDEYAVHINGIRCVVLRNRDWEDGCDPWASATTRPLTVVNQLLTAAGRSDARAHTLCTGGNEGLVYLIDPGVAEAIRISGLLPDHEIPALAAEPFD